MDINWRKLILSGSAIVFLVCLPFVLCSTWFLNKTQGWIDQNPKGSKAPWAQFEIGWIYLTTLRPEQAVEPFQRYIKNYDPGPPPTEGTPEKMQAYKEAADRHAEAMFDYALSLDEWATASIGHYEVRVRARDAYEQFKEKYPSHPEVSKAEMAINRLNVQLK